MTKERKLRIVRVICFFLVTYFVLFFIGTIFQTKNKEDYASYRTSQLKYVFNERENSLDVVAIGHSGVLYGFSPMELYDHYGITSYNLSRTGLAPWEAHDLLLEVLNTQSPKVVILNMDSYFYDKLENCLNFAGTGILTKAFPIFNNHTRWRSYLPGGEDKHKRSITKNQVIDKRVRPYSGKERMRPTHEERRMFSMYRKSLEKITKLCKDSGIELVLIEMPSMVHWDYTRHNTIAQFAQENNLTFIDFNVNRKEFGIDWDKHTCDKGDHLNLTGSKIVTLYLGEFIKTNYNLQSHRDDPAYASWEEDLKTFRNKYGK